MNRLTVTLAAGLLCALVHESFADPSYLYGLHDAGGESNMSSNKGWLVFTEAIGHNPGDMSGGNYSAYSTAGYGVIVRLNNGYGSAGTIPADTDYANFATRCANFISHSSGTVLYWIIGNETNLPREWPGNNNGDPATGQPITVARYVNCYNQAYTAIKNVVPSAKVIPTPSGTWAPPYSAQGVEGFVDYWINILNGIGASKIDGLALHCYTHGCDPALVTDNSKMGPPYTTINYNFRVYQNYMSSLPASFTSKPVMITECDQNIECADNANPKHAWSNVNNGWVRAIYSEINSWNQSNAQKIRCVVLFRWPMAVEGDYTFGLQDRNQVIADFQQAVAFAYRWDSVSMNNSTPTGVNVAPSAVTVQTDSNFDATFPGTLATDSSLSTKWCSTGSAPPHWIALDLGSSKTVNGFIFRMGGAGGEFTSYNFKAFRIQSASSLAGPWSDEAAVDNSAQASVVPRSYITPKSLRYVRMYITDTGIDSFARLYEFEVWAAATQVPPTPTGLVATAGNAQVSLTWSASSGATSYNVKRSTTNGGPYTTVSSPTTTSFTDTGRTNGTTYYYVVSAANGNGESGNSTQASATPAAAPPVTPTGLVATATASGQVSLTWNASAFATGYKVKRSTTSGSSYSTIGTPAGASFVDSGLSNGTLYYYVVSATNGLGESGNSNQMNATPSSINFPVIVQRGNGLANTFAKLNSGQSAVIAYFGGSITQNTGYRDNVTAWFNSMYPGKITEINAGWSGTGSLIGAMRLLRDVLNANPDLIFVEFAVNDLPEDPLLFGERNAEGIVRQAWMRNANIDVCFVETIAYYTESSYLSSQYPTAVQAHNATGTLYGVPTVNVGWQLYTRVLAGTAWTSLAPDRVHPNSTGSAIYSGEAIIPYLNMERTRGAASGAHAIAAALTDYPVMSSTITEMASLSGLPAAWSKQFNQYGAASFIQSSTAGSTVTLNFTGPAAAAKIVVAPDGGGISYSVDGGTFASGNISSAPSPYLWAFPVAKTSSISGSHSLTLRVDSGMARILNVESANTTTSKSPDFDNDGDVDVTDFAHFDGCRTGANAGPPTPGCQDADFNSDSDVDQSDFGLFQRCLSGVGLTFNVACLN